MQSTDQGDNQICTYEDDWLRDHLEQNAIWIVTLSNGQTVYQDDGRPGLSTHSAWIRLRNYCKSNNVKIVDMVLRFRSHFEGVGKDADAYFFRKSLLASMMGGNNTHFYIAGAVREGILTVRKWRVPELIWDTEEVRDIEESGQSLI